MPLNSMRHFPVGYEMPSMPDLCGPSDLATAILSYIEFQRRTGFDAGLPPLSESGLRRLIDLVYYASQTPEEGRYPRFTIVARAHPVFWVLANLQGVQLTDVNVLRRLAPTCAENEHALWVSERDGVLQCDGLVTTDPMVRFQGQPGVVPLSGGPFLHVRAHGPGHLDARLESGASSCDRVMSITMRAGDSLQGSRIWWLSRPS
jgi:hypothetical protein